MTISRGRALPVALALAAVGVMVMASVASATHPRPSYAGKLTRNLVPAFNECTTGANRNHGPPLAGPSCNPPVKTSDALTIGGNMTGAIALSVVEGAPGPPEDSDVKITIDIANVRCDNDGIGDSTACGAANTTGGPDYTGFVLGLAQIRITDHWNGVAEGGGTDPATVTDDLVFGVVIVHCAPTVSTAVGSDCDITTSWNSVVGTASPVAKDGQRAVVEFGQVEVWDGAESPASPERFLVQGIFIP